ncbi:TPA: AbrB/MazE/SpoVT family DNA-binding domain-containing protein [Photobacterium damselae]
MRVQVRKSGNSAVLRIPPNVLRDLKIDVGDELDMSVNQDSVVFEKVKTPRDGWAESVCVQSAQEEADMMEQEFGRFQDESMDEWDGGEAW